jgi:hypothetical protein
MNGGNEKVGEELDDTEILFAQIPTKKIKLKNKNNLSKFQKKKLKKKIFPSIIFHVRSCKLA